MTDNQLFDQLRQLRLPSRSYAVFGSGPLVIRGIIPLANDLDVICNDDAWRTVENLPDAELIQTNGVVVASLFDGALTFGQEWGIGDFDTTFLIRTAEIIADLPFVRMEHVIRYKAIRDSAKDQRHLAALQQYVEA